jgi:S-(hydroxymethyl)glutathione dehydrogenase / alcohol dehydrogenase
MVSAFPVIAIDVRDSKVEMAKRWGASHAFNSKTTADLKERILEIVGPQGADVVVDTTGRARVIEQAYDLTHPDGRTILVGVPRKGDNVNIYTLPLHFKKVLKGSHGGDSAPDEDIPRLTRLFRHKKIELDSLITHEFPLERINEALDVVRSGEAGRVLIRMG